MPSKPPPGMTRPSWPLGYIKEFGRRIKEAARTVWACYRYPHAVHFNVDASEWYPWYENRYVWILQHIPQARRMVWLHYATINIYDQHTMLEQRVQGELRFRKERDKLMFLLRWS